MAPIVEPVKQKLVREMTASRLDDITSQLNDVIVDSPSSPLIEYLLAEGSQACTDFQKSQQEYIEMFPAPTDESLIDDYTKLIMKYEKLLSAWRKLSAAAYIHVRKSNGTRNDSVNTKKPDRPVISLNMSEAQWSFFLDEWRIYKNQANIITDAQIVPELRSCCTIELRRSVFDFVGSSELETITADQLLTAIRQCAVRGKSVAVHRHEFYSARQAHGQHLHEYVAGLRAKAEQCQFVTKCPNTAVCTQTVSYAADMVSDQMVIGCYDTDIQGEILSKSSTLTTFQLKFDAMQALETGKEARNELTKHNMTPSLPSVAAQSEYKKSKSANRAEKNNNQKPEAKCFGCGGALHAPSLREHAIKKRSVCPARDTVCEVCNRKGHYSTVCKQARPQAQSSSVQAQDTLASDSEFCVFAVENHTHSLTPNLTGATAGETVVPHMEWRNGAFKATRPAAQPQLMVQLEVLDCCHEEFGKTRPRLRRQERNLSPIRIRAIADTGAQTCTAGPDLLEALHVPKGYLISTSHHSVGIDHNELAYMGCVFISISAGKHTTNQAVYITTGVRGLYLSRTAQVHLKIIDEHFPSAENDTSTINAAESSSGESSLAPCGCPPRQRPPLKPTHLPYPATPENRELFETWIKDRYKSSAFNTCDHQSLPMMSGRPLDLHFIDSIEPTAYHTPIPIPHHWKKRVKEELDRDVRIGTLELVPQGTPVNWCSRMVVVPKHDNSPRRVVDLQKLNAATKRETHHTPAPYNQVSVIPPNKKKTVLDAWNGYHSLSLAPSARDATSFITEWGRYRYLRAPQGFHAAGDGYTRRYDDITVDVKQKAKCIDDTLLWDEDIESAFWHTIDYLDLCSANGIVFNPQKFHFAEDEVEFAGFTVTLDGIKPSQSTLDAILNFPTPKDITGVRSWFGLVNQIAYAIAISSRMAPFRDLLKPRQSWYWDETLDRLFRETKQEIVAQIEHGVTAFEVDRPTCIATDWSKTGMGFFLLQKHCQCSMSKAPNCCVSGWKLVLAGSRFANEAESRYAPIEGEALSLVEALEKCRIFVLGCPQLLIATDHKPLLKIFADRALEDIKNQRLLRLKERSLMYRFQLTHVPGGWHVGPDALSRYPSPTQTALVDSAGLDSEIQTGALAALQSVYDDEFQAVTWDSVKQAVSADPVMVQLVDAITKGFPDAKDKLPVSLHPYWNVRDLVSCVDGVPMVGPRVVVPISLRPRVLENLHAAHQGVSSMRSRAALSVYWPNIRNSIQQRRDQCRTCNRITPSNPVEPMVPTPTPEYPYQQVCADFFHQAGHDYLIYVDRYTSWINIVQMTGNETAPALIKAIRMMFDFGVPEELATDGGPPFTSHEVSNFLLRWGIKNRLSSAYYSQSNGRAELAVKAAKRIIADNTGPRGELNTDRVAAALLQHRNTPSGDTGLSPSQMLFGRNLRESIPFTEQALKIRPEWKSLLDDRERALAKRHIRAMERYDEHARPLVELNVGDKVLVQNQHGFNAKRWDKTGTVVDKNKHRQYSVKMDGSGRHTLRNRRFLKKIVPVLADPPMATFDPPQALNPSNPSRTAVSSPEFSRESRAEQIPTAAEHTDTEPVQNDIDIAVVPGTVPDMPGTGPTPDDQSTPPDSDNLVPVTETQGWTTVRRSTRVRRKPRTLSPALRGQAHGFSDQ